MAQDNSHQSATIAGIAVASAAMGAAMAVLLTPKSGREIREKLVQKAKRVDEKGQDLADKAKSTTGH